jgi:thioredoxin reductase (NADPH)
VDAIATDALVIGAGPTGLFQVFQLGLLGLSCHVVDALAAPGGQCIELYPDKPIYDIPAVPVCSGRELVDRLLAQIDPLKPTLHLGQQVSSLSTLADGRFAVGTSGGTRFICRTVFVAAGVGAFQPRRLALEGVEPLLGRQVFHSGEAPGPVAGRHVVILGEDDAALECALDLADRASDAPASVTLMHRREAFKADAETVARMRAACADGRMRFLCAQASGVVSSAGTLTHLKVSLSDGSELTVPVDVLMVLWGLSPRLGPVVHWGLAMERKQLQVNTESFETSVPGIYAVGDINTYPGKKKLIVCGFHEATLAAYAAAERIDPERSVQVQYTTTSSHIHRLLGVDAPKP